MSTFTISDIESRASKVSRGFIIPQPNKRYFDVLRNYGIVASSSLNEPVFSPTGKLMYVLHEFDRSIFDFISPTASSLHQKQQKQQISDFYSVQLWRGAWETVASELVDQGLPVAKMNYSDVIRIVVFHLEAQQARDLDCYEYVTQNDSVVDEEIDEILTIDGYDVHQSALDFALPSPITTRSSYISSSDYPTL